MGDASDDDLAALKAQLHARREELVQLEAASTEASRTVELDQSRVGRLSRMDALQMQEMSKETARRRGIERKRIDAALARMETDEYGVCVRCGEEIGAKRLALDPTAPNCIDCAEHRDG